MDMQLEEGEISDNSEDGGINPYVPLERPVAHYKPTNSNGNETPAMEEDATSSNLKKPPVLLKSDSDTDDELIGQSKRMKLFVPANNSNSKYNIWNKDPDGDLTDILNQVGMEEEGSFVHQRNVENYPLPFKPTFKQDNSNLQFRKRKIPKRRKSNCETKQNVNKTSKILDLLEVNESNTIEEVAEDITKKLNECNDELILRIVLILGKDKAIQLYDKTRVIEKLGGMLIVNGSRKRTSGGVFIFLVRNDKELSEDKFNAIFENETFHEKNMYKGVDKMRKKRKNKNSRRSKNKDISSELSNPPPSPDLPELPQRKDVLTELADLDQQKGITDELQREEDEDDLTAYEDMDFPELV